MSAKPLRRKASVVEGSQFLDVYPICSRLISEIGRDFIRSWTVEEANSHRVKFVDRLVAQGCPPMKAEVAWNLIAQDHAKDDTGVFQSPNIASPLYLAPTSASQPAGTSPVAVPDENVFCFEGGRWVVKFHGLTVYPQDITGIKYLHCLISKPGETYSPRELYDGFGRGSRVKNSKTMNAREAIQTGLGSTRAQPDVLIDRQGQEEMLARLECIEVEMGRAKSIPNADLIEKLAMERIRIKEQLRKAFTPVGSRRIQEPELVRRMKAVDIAIRRAKEKIQRAGHNALLRHLNETIEVKVKSGCSYLPSRKIVWRTQAVPNDVPTNPR